MTVAKTAARTWGRPVFLALLAVGIAINFALLVPVIRKQARQSREGQKARDTQCRTFPVAIKLYTAGERYHLITAADLQTYLAAAPKGCPRPPR